MRTMTATELADSFFEQVDPFLNDLDEGILISQDRCVDRLLDLFNSTESPVIRREIAEVLNDIRHLSAVETSEVRMQVFLLAACAAVEAAFDFEDR